MSRLFYTKDGRNYINIFGIKISFKKKVNNKFILYREDGSKIINPRMKLRGGGSLKVVFKGSNALVEIYEPINAFQNTRIVAGNNSRISIKSTKYAINNLTIDAFQGYNHVIIGQDFSIASGNFFVDIGSNLTIGDDCMFSAEINVRTGDAHQLYHNNELIRPGDVTIGNHCWVGLKSFMLKNTVLMNNTIVGTGSIVTKAFKTPNCAVGGSPARVLKENMHWRRSAFTEIETDRILNKEEAIKLVQENKKGVVL